jgi:hypothetical protein
MQQTGYGHFTTPTTTTHSTEAIEKNGINKGISINDCHDRNDSNTYDYESAGSLTVLPTDTVPMDVIDTEQGWRMSGHLPMMTEEKKTIQNGTFMEYLLSQEEHISQYYTQIKFFIVPMKIYELFKSTKKVKIATDGGAIPLKGSLGFVFDDE